MSIPSAEPVTRVSALERFFDLVFVFTFTQLSHILAGDLTWAGLGRVLLFTMTRGPPGVRGALLAQLR